MNGVRKQRLLVLCVVLITLALVSALVMYALRQNINLFFTPTQILQGEAKRAQHIRLGGMVVPGSISRNSQNLRVEFKLTDYKHTINISYDGVLPDLFREGKGVVVEGILLNDRRFKADLVLAKHDENYMPPQVKEALTKRLAP